MAVIDSLIRKIDSFAALRKIERLVGMFILASQLPGCVSPAPDTSPNAAAANAIVPRVRLSAAEVAEQYPIRWRASLMQYAAPDGQPDTAGLVLRGVLRPRDGVVGFSNAIMTGLEDWSGRAVPPGAGGESPERFSTSGMRQSHALTGKVEFDVSLPTGITAYRRIAGQVEAVVVAEGQTTEFVAGVPTDWTSIGEGMSMCVTAWVRERDGGERVEFGILHGTVGLAWNGWMRSLRLPLLVATDLAMTDGRSQVPLVFSCAGTGIGGGRVQELGTIRFVPPAPTGDNAALPRALLVRTASKLRIDQIPIELHDVAAR